MLSSHRKLMLVIDDTPTNVTVVSGVLKDQFRTTLHRRFPDVLISPIVS